MTRLGNGATLSRKAEPWPIFIVFEQKTLLHQVANNRRSSRRSHRLQRQAFDFRSRVNEVILRWRREHRATGRGYRETAKRSIGRCRRWRRRWWAAERRWCCFLSGKDGDDGGNRRIRGWRGRGMGKSACGEAMGAWDSWMRRKDVGNEWRRKKRGERKGYGTAASAALTSFSLLGREREGGWFVHYIWKL